MHWELFGENANFYYLILPVQEQKVLWQAFKSDVMDLDKEWKKLTLYR